MGRLKKVDFYYLLYGHFRRSKTQTSNLWVPLQIFSSTLSNHRIPDQVRDDRKKYFSASP